MYGFGAFQPPGYACLASASETADTMMTSSPCFQFTGVATLCFAVGCQECTSRRPRRPRGRINYLRAPHASRSGRVYHGSRDAARATLGGLMFQPNERVTVDLSGLVIQGVSFTQNVRKAIGTILQQVSTDPPVYKVELLFSFKGIKRVDVPEERIHRS